MVDDSDGVEGLICWVSREDRRRAVIKAINQIYQIYYQ